MYQQMELLMCTFSFLTSFLLLSSPAFLLRLSSFKGVPLSTIPNAHMEANKYVLCLPRYESFNVKVTWQIFSIPNVKTTMDFPKGTVFQQLCEIRLAGQERHNAPTTHIPWKTMGNGILIVTLGNALRWGSWGPTGMMVCRYNQHPLPVQIVTLYNVCSFFLTNKIFRCTHCTQKE